ncbi:MAG: endonuclease III [Nitrospirota bacterium]
MKNILPIIKKLKKQYPDAGIELKFKNTFQLLVVVILSAQCTDARVNLVSPGLFKKFPDVRDFAECKLVDLEKAVFSTGFYRNKAKNIKAAAQKILSDFGGKVPGAMDELLKLPGVARKTANVILNEGFGKSEGIVVDTHVIRISGLLGLVSKKLSASKNAVKIEAELMKIVPKKDWHIISHLITWHGRRICIARRPKCEICPLNQICPSSTVLQSKRS